MAENIKKVEHPIIDYNLSILRDKNSTSSDFRRALDTIATVLSIEIFKDLKTKNIEVETPLEITSTKTIDHDIILIPILRAGLGILQPFINIYPHAKVGYIGMSRNENNFEAIEYYFNVPAFDEDTKVILLEVMIATGGSICSSLSRLQLEGVKDLNVVSVISAPEGIERILTEFPKVNLVTAALDRELNSQKYILPGLGDAGDRINGTQS